MLKCGSASAALGMQCRFTRRENLAKYERALTKLDSFVGRESSSTALESGAVKSAEQSAESDEAPSLLCLTPSAVLFFLSSCRRSSITLGSLV